jgi:hypothetical protein
MAQKKKKVKGLPNMGNRPMYDGIVSKYTSNAATGHVTGTTRANTRLAAKQNAIKDQRDN